jgi:DNA-binding transcriptional LysR family regulator
MLVDAMHDLTHPSPTAVPFRWSLTQLHHFIALAVEGSFARAGARVDIGSAALRQSIAGLEDALNVQLLDPQSNDVALTPAGFAFLGEARQVLEQAQLAEMVARRTAQERSMELRIGMVPLGFHTAMGSAVSDMVRCCPEITLLVSEMSSEEQMASLRRGSIDIGCCFLSDIDKTGFELLEVFRSRVRVALPADHPLARQPAVELAQLAELPMILFHSPTAPTFRQTIVEACREAGFEPRVLHESRQLGTTVAMVERGLGFALISEAPASYPLGGAKLLPLQGPTRGLDRRVGALWMPRGESTALQSFLLALRKQLTQAAMVPTA